MKVLRRLKEKKLKKDLKEILLSNLNKIHNELCKSSKIIIEFKDRGESRIICFMGKTTFSFNRLKGIDFELLRAIFTFRSIIFSYLALILILILFIILILLPYGYLGGIATLLLSLTLLLNQLMSVGVKRVKEVGDIFKVHQDLYNNNPKYFHMYNSIKYIILKASKICENSKRTSFARGFLRLEGGLFKYLCTFEKKTCKMIFYKQ